MNGGQLKEKTINEKIGKKIGIKNNKLIKKRDIKLKSRQFGDKNDKKFFNQNIFKNQNFS